MPAPSPPLRRGPAERLAAWLATGPPGHLWSIAADVATFGARWLWQGAREWVAAQRSEEGDGRRPSARR